MRAWRSGGPYGKYQRRLRGRQDSPHTLASELAPNPIPSWTPGPLDGMVRDNAYAVLMLLTRRGLFLRLGDNSLVMTQEAIRQARLYEAEAAAAGAAAQENMGVRIRALRGDTRALPERFAGLVSLW